MQENEKKPWEQVEKHLASEIIAGRERLSRAKDFFIVCLTVAVIAIGLGMAIINYMNDQDWRELFTSYDYVSQDGEGYNYYNSDIGGDVNNGAEDKTEERPEEAQRN